MTIPKNKTPWFDKSILGENALYIGSLYVKLHCSEQHYAQKIATLFGTELILPSFVRQKEPNLDITICTSSVLHDKEIPTDGFIITYEDYGYEIHTEVVSTYIDKISAPQQILLFVTDTEITDYDLRVHFAVIFHKALFLLRYMILHAAAVLFSGSVSLFIGPKGAGKSTISLKLACEGGTILGEDHVLVKQNSDEVLVSGCGELSRVTAKTEAYFFPQKLAVSPVEREGIAKKEFYLSQYFSCNSYSNYPLEHIFFTRVGECFQLQSLGKKSTLLKLILETKPLQRFANKQDYENYLHYLTNCTNMLESYQLKLSPNIDDLNSLVDFLRDSR